MRIISGKFKSKRIIAPKKLPVRPTTDMAKEGLFNILNNRYHFPQLSVLDLFSGIGSISLEFASRGVNDITCVDKHYQCVKFLSKTAEELEIDLQTIKSDVYSFLENTSKKYDIIFADPPYDFDTDSFLKIVDLVLERKLLNEDGLIIIEHAKYTDLSEHPNFEEKRGYGGNVFSFFNLG
ncbi:MAG: RsmD family RNA methyltransferase [Bacteroidota bacterium]